MLTAYGVAVATAALVIITMEHHEWEADAP